VEVPHLDRWYRRYRQDGLVVIGVSTASPKEQREFAQRFNLSYPLFRWEREKVPPLLLAVRNYPTTLLIDRSGKIREVTFGILFGEEREAFESKLRALIKEALPKKGGKQK